MAVSISDPITYKRLVAAGNDDIYYEDIDVAVGTMIELAAATSDIDTSDNLNMFEAYQKVFIVNGAKLKVADFINTKLTHSALGTAHAHGDILTQDQGSSNIAYMVVDYTTGSSPTVTYGYAYYAGSAVSFDTTTAITGSGSGSGFTPTGVNGVLVHSVLGTAHAAADTLTQAVSGATMVVEYTDAAKTHTYGRITSGTFDTTNEVTGDGSGSAFTPTLVDISPPLWYDWVKYSGSTTGLPNKAYLGCNYRGRCVISGDPEHPHQWYMSRQANPWDFTYIANDAQSPIKGGNSDAGEIGDIVRALIPYKDDYLIFGCATTIWFMAGDAAEGGSINELDLTVGIFGANSWCFDGMGNLYFWGDNGIYRTTIPGTPECISEIRLPDLVKDETLDPASYRITMAYDRARAGILVCITKLSDGSNSNYWYDLRTKGFFPETYPDECGPYSLFNYGANNYAYRDLLVGCKDGYIRKFDVTAKSDDIGGSDQAIDSHVQFGPIQIAEDLKFTGKITRLDLVTAGGAASGSQSDSDDVVCKVFTANSAEEVKEKLSAGTIPNFSKTMKAPGRRRGDTIRRKISGIYAGIELRNSTTAESWAFEQLLIDAKQSGRMK